MTTTPPLPRVIITPSTPLFSSSSNFDSTRLPSPRSAGRSTVPAPIPLDAISEKPRTRSRSLTTSSTTSNSSKSESTYHSFSDIEMEKGSYIRPIPILNPTRSYSLPSFPSEAYLAPPRLSAPRSGKRPLRSPLISVVFLLFAFLLVLSTAMCTSSSAGRLLDLQRAAGEKIHGLLQFNLEGCGKDAIAKSASSTKAGTGEDTDLTGQSDSLAQAQNEMEVKASGNGLLDLLFWHADDWREYRDQWTHSIASAGPAISLDGAAIWDFDSLSL
ncbi:uncharacterized protein I303_107130 [Kwoniella dejecticola CBS 10117]|uniref:Uncharacterized protein n=1 Tax=Kwoniella dejecticola CBS 10117 TaxID=1296121 RepID=A0A1A5ZYT9_9TREE|nr:uncharacterized protein I303_06532 [Kwoniella dejecticola CBS 10117]OBR82974.1 hypothetical protein I303_06532 [Kwoniella dejecticola CBS 10117]